MTITLAPMVAQLHASDRKRLHMLVKVLDEMGWSDSVPPDERDDDELLWAGESGMADDGSDELSEHWLVVRINQFGVPSYECWFPIPWGNGEQEAHAITYDPWTVVHLLKLRVPEGMKL